jgi:arylsulfatase A-like enzyme
MGAAMSVKNKILAAGLIAGATMNGAVCGAEPGKPNIVLILMDDLGGSDLGCTGSTFYKTPNIDRLCSQSMRFTQAYANAPICSPSRASIIFGQYPARLRLTDWIPGRKVPYGKVLCPQHKYFVDIGTPSIAGELKKAGYVSALIGKTHISNDQKHGPAAHGFDVVYEDWGLNSSSTPEDPKGVFKLTEEAVKFMEDNRDHPFFLLLSHYAVHDPIQSNAGIQARYEESADMTNPQHKASYAAMLDDADRSIGVLLDKIEKMGLNDNTVIVFFSDNGGLISNTSNFPYRDGKGSLYEGGIREPLFIRWPGRVKAGSQSAEIVAGIDLMPTFMELAGVSGSGLTLDGASLVPVITGTGGLKRDAVFWHYPHYYYPAYLPCSAVRAGSYKLIHFYGDERDELYDMEKDISEQKDLSKQMPEKTAELRSLLEQWKKSVDAQETTVNPAYDPVRSKKFNK